MTSDFDAIVVGSGPNGLSAALTLAQAGCSVLVVEAKDSIGGGTRTKELTLPGYMHDVCSAIHPLAVASPFFTQLPLEDYGLEWLHPAAPLAHPLDNEPAIIVERSVTETGTQLGSDENRYNRLITPFVEGYHKLMHEFLGPLRFPRHPFMLARFGPLALLPATLFSNTYFKTERARALFAGMSAHSIMALERPATTAFGLMLTTLAHGVGWPVARGGSQCIAEALAGYLKSLGGQITTGWEVQSLDELLPARLVLFDITPRQLLSIAGDRLPPAYRKRLQKYRYGPGVFKIDYALSEPIPWRDPACRRSATVHVGGTLSEIAVSEHAMWHGRHTEKPFVLVAQQTLFDQSRAPEGKHTAWAYCHVPHGSTEDMTPHIEAQIERFAPGFKDTILARHTFTTDELQSYNPNYIGGDINGGIQDLRQLFTRPVLRFSPYSTPDPQLFLCSSSTPPGGGVHGVAGYFAAHTAIKLNKHIVI